MLLAAGTPSQKDIGRSNAGADWCISKHTAAEVTGAQNRPPCVLECGILPEWLRTRLATKPATAGWFRKTGRKGWCTRRDISEFASLVRKSYSGALRGLSTLVLAPISVLKWESGPTGDQAYRTNPV